MTRRRQTHMLLSTIQEVTIVYRDDSLQNPASLEQAIVETATIQSSQELMIQNHSSASNSVSRDHTSLTAHSHFGSNQEPEESSASSHIRITTTIPRKNCDATCICQCHIRTQFRTPPWLSALVGTLFYSSSYNPSPETRPCNSRFCSRSQSSYSSRFTYYFPTWMMRTALVYSTWDNLDGCNASWMIRMPREISNRSPHWKYISSGSLDRVQNELSEKSMTPFDCGDNDGESLLQVCQAAILPKIQNANIVYPSMQCGSGNLIFARLWPQKGLIGMLKTDMDSEINFRYET